MAKSKVKPALAIAFGAPKGASEDEEMMLDEDPEESGGDFEELAARLFPDVDPSDLKALIHACVDEGY